MSEILASLSWLHVAAVVAISTGLFLYSKPSPLRSIPSVPFWDTVQLLLQIRTFEEYTKKCAYFVLEPIQRIMMGSQWLLLVTTPEHAKQLFTQLDVFPKVSPSVMSKLTPIIFGMNIALANGELWRKYRKACNPAFQKLFPTTLLRGIAKDMIDQWDPLVDAGVEIEVCEWMHKLALDMLGRAIFDYPFNRLSGGHSETVQDYELCMEGLLDVKYNAFKFLDGKWNPLRRKYYDAADRLNAFFLDMIVKRKAEVKARLDKEARGEVVEQSKKDKDLLTLMLESFYDEENETLSNEEIKCQLAVFFLAGHDSTAIVITCHMYYLALHPEAQRRAREEVLKFLPTDEHLDPNTRLPYLEAIIKESLRLHPPADMLLFSDIAKDVKFEGKNGTVHDVKAGSAITTLEFTALHRNPAIWSDPEAFIPERWFDTSDKRGDKQGAYYPFGGGPRICIGKNCSLLEQRVTMTMLLRRYEWSLPTNSPHKDDLKSSGLIIIKPDPMKMRIRRYNP
jgi:cytochrome P450